MIFKSLNIAVNLGSPKINISFFPLKVASTSTYVIFGLTAKKRFDGRVHGVVVQPNIFLLGSLTVGKVIITDGSCISL